MSKPSYKKKAQADTTLAQRDDLISQIKAMGWNRKDMVIADHHGTADAGYLLFHRQIQNQKKPSKDAQFFPKSRFGEKPDSDQIPKTLVLQGFSGEKMMGANSPMGGAHSNFAPAPTGAAGEMTVSSFSQILSIREMRSADESFVVAFDTEFYYRDGLRYVLSWQFTFVDPACPDSDCIEELMVFASQPRTLSLSKILAFICEEWGIGTHFGLPSADGVPYWSTRRWYVPVTTQNGDVVGKYFSSFNDALANCCDPVYKASLQKAGEKKRCTFSYVEGRNGRMERYPDEEVNGFGVGYVNDYSDANKKCIPVTLVCHSGTADLSTLNVDDLYEKDLMKKLSAVQGGLVTLTDFYTHNPQLKKYWNLYPFRICVRDTMCYAPSKSKSLAAIGETIGVPKLEVALPYSKDDMLSFMTGDLGQFCEYAINDSVIALIYAGELWGYNKSYPVTITSASTRVAVPVIKSSFGLAEDDDVGFDIKFRGLHKVKKGLSQVANKSGYIENTALEPVSDNARIIHEYARNAYKGGYNACFRPGYYEGKTFDFDLENAYPTCMALVPDIDWSNPIAFETVNQVLSPMMVRTPFDPVFGYVTFRFPHTVKMPCIPVSVDGSMIYPYTSGDMDGVYASAPELWLALKLGAEVFVKRMYVGNILADENGDAHRSLFYVVKQFIEDRTIAKASFGQGSLMELLIKLSTNGLYGKTAQDVIDKSTWSARSEEMENIGGSRITSPVHSCLTTAGVRAVLLAALNQISNLGYTVYSVTTDGFITDCPEDILNSLDLYGLARYFRGARRALTGRDDMWSMKHLNPHLLNLTTRGNVSLEVGNPDKKVLPGVMAHNSFATGYEPDSYEDRLAFMSGAMSRTGKMKTSSISFEKFKNLSKRVDRTDFSAREQEREISMDFDLKRKPIFSTMVDSQRYFAETGIMGVVASFDTEPYETPAEFVYYKNIGRSCTVLRTVADWQVFADKIAAKTDGVRRHIKDLAWSKLVSCIMAYRLEIPLAAYGNVPVHIPYLDDPNISVADKVEWINQFNSSRKNFTLNTWKDCRKQTRASQVLSESLYIDLLQEMISWKMEGG